MNSKKLANGFSNETRRASTRHPLANNTNPGLASVILAEVRVVVLCLNIQFVMYLHDTSDMPGQRMQQLTLVECRHNSGERYDASLGKHRQTSAAGELTLLNEEGDAVLQITIGGVHG